jgi:trigger factor
MSVKMEETKTNTVKLTIAVDPDAFEQSMQKAYLKVRKSVMVPGFRKGKAPRRIIENFYGGESFFYEEAFNLAFPEAYERAIEETGIEPVDRPNLDIESIGSGKGLVFTAEVTVKPKVRLGVYKGIEVVKPEYNVTAEDVERQIEQARNDAARWIDAEGRAIENGDRIVLDYEGSVDGKAFQGGSAKNRTLDIGSGEFIPGFEDQLIGLSAGEEREIRVRFPADYHDEKLREKEAVFRVKVISVSYQELPEADDEFAKDVSQFDTMEQYRRGVRETLEKEAPKRPPRKSGTRSSKRRRPRPSSKCLTAWWKTKSAP